jgi:hypothetical protein
LLLVNGINGASIAALTLNDVKDAVALTLGLVSIISTLLIIRNNLRNQRAPHTKRTKTRSPRRTGHRKGAALDVRKILFCAAVVLLASGCSAIPRAQKGGRIHSIASATNLISEAVQPENPSGPASQSQEWIEETLFTVPAGSVVRSDVRGANDELLAVGATDRPVNHRDAESAEVRSENPGVSFRISETMPVKRTVQKRSSATVGGSQKDEGRALGVRFQAMKPVQWTGIALCAASIAAFYFGWPTIGFLSLAVGAGMIVTAAVLPGHELLILGVGSAGVLIAAGLVVYAYRTGHLDGASNQPTVVPNR